MSATMLSVRETAERLGVSYSTLKQWIYKGSVRTVRTSGGHHRVPTGRGRPPAGPAGPGGDAVPRRTR